MTPMPFRWTGDGFELLSNWKRVADRELVIGQVYRLEEVQGRSIKSHDHQFAFLAEAWKNLPESLTDRFPTPESLRKTALIDAGYFNETVIDVGNSAGAERVAAYLRFQDEFAHIVVRRGVVVVRVAKSQSRRSMSPRDFQESKQKVLEIVAAMIGVEPEALTREAGKAA